MLCVLQKCRNYLEELPCLFGQLVTVLHCSETLQQMFLHWSTAELNVGLCFGSPALQWAVPYTPLTLL